MTPTVPHVLRDGILVPCPMGVSGPINSRVTMITIQRERHRRGERRLFSAERAPRFTRLCPKIHLQAEKTSATEGYHVYKAPTKKTIQAKHQRGEHDGSSTKCDLMAKNLRLHTLAVTVYIFSSPPRSHTFVTARIAVIVTINDFIFSTHLIEIPHFLLP